MATLLVATRQRASEHDPDDEKERELKENDEPTGEKCEPGIAFIFGREESLHHQLFCAVAGGSEEATTEEAGPKGVRLGEEVRGHRESEIEDLKFVSIACHLDHVIPPAGDLLEDDEEAEYGAGDVEEHLDDVGPDDGSHAALECVEEREADDE